MANVYLNILPANTSPTRQRILKKEKLKQSLRAIRGNGKQYENVNKGNEYSNMKTIANVSV